VTFVAFAGRIASMDAMGKAWPTPAETHKTTVAVAAKNTLCIMK